MRLLRGGGKAVLLLLLLAAEGCGQAPWARPTFAIPGHGSLKLAVPAGWRVSSKAIPEPPSLNIDFGPSSGDAFSLQLTAVWLDSGKLANTSPASLKATAAQSAEVPLQQAVETAAVIQELRGAKTIGYYFSLTDRAPPPAEYKYLTQGTCLTGEVLVAFTFLNRELPSPEKDQALRLLADAIHSK